MTGNIAGNLWATAPRQGRDRLARGIKRMSKLLRGWTGAGGAASWLT
jgi:hypothetical protein